jgi:hypothetical protein
LKFDELSPFVISRKVCIYLKVSGQIYFSCSFYG